MQEIARLGTGSKSLIVPGSKFVLARAVFLPNHFEQKQMKDEDEKTDGEPKDGRQSAELVAVLVEGYYVMFMRRC